MRRFFHLQLIACMLCLSATALRHHRASRALGYVPPYLPGLNRVTSDPSVSPAIFEWNAHNLGYFSRASASSRGEKGMSNPWLHFQHRPQFHTRAGHMFRHSL
ncbi:Hypothetical predicted protein [Cloeon dipterum]|uniref:Secreted protein n=1 Tax=Cloeon dipterum TaxID=197152 RepID=A0A8S1DH69_9INSE|nr:Hypothetical predicted protein [Cloeon dipterum]